MLEAHDTFGQLAAVDLAAARYRAEGYDVLVKPEQDQLPDDLRSFQPDLLARRGKEIVVVEVKTRQALAAEKQVQELAQAVRDKPDRRFDLILVTPDRLDEGRQSVSSWWDGSQVRARLTEVRALIDGGHPEAAIVLTFAATEAALRLAARAEDDENKDYSLPYVLKLAATRGVISQEFYRSIQDLREFRKRPGPRHLRAGF